MQKILLLLCLLAITINTTAKQITGTIKVRSSSGAHVLPNVTCTLKSIKEVIPIGKSNQFGEIYATIAAGNYTLVCKMDAATAIEFKVNLLEDNFWQPIIYTINYIKTPNTTTTTSYKSKLKEEKKRIPSEPTFAVSAPTGKTSNKTRSRETAKPRMETIAVITETKYSETDDVTAPPMPVSNVDMGMLTPTEVPTLKRTKPAADAPKAGLLTTGEVNDFTKWNLFEDVSRDELLKHLNGWKINTTNRYCIQALNNSGNPVLNAKAVLYINEIETYTAYTDNTGKAELWAHLFNDVTEEYNYMIKIFYQNKTYVNIKPTTFNNGINNFSIKTDCNYSNAVDIAFVVDATGSMGDEINYLKTEVTDVINRAKSVNTNLNFKTAAVFYQDNTDAYLTIKSDFSSDLNVTTNFINKQYADGGGDFPEAVDEALAVGIHELSWTSNARTKIIFLILDAPPHNDDATKNRIYKLIQQAAAKGIKIIPIAGSGINKNTEYILRCMALATNGTYTFLTNHSGIGNNHIAPSTDNFKVEKMNDLLIRLITQYTYVPECNTVNKDTVNNENPFSLQTVVGQIDVYPNPVVNIVKVKLPKAANGEIIITDISGKIVQRVISAEATLVEIDLSNMPNGFYFVRAKVGEVWLTQKIIKQG